MNLFPGSVMVARLPLKQFVFVRPEAGELPGLVFRVPISKTRNLQTCKTFPEVTPGEMAGVPDSRAQKDGY